MATTKVHAPALRIPRLIKRNTILLAVSQALVGAGSQFVPALGPAMVLQLLGSASLAGIGTSISGVSRFLIAYPLGYIMDAYGRRAGLVLGLALGLLGAILVGLAMIALSFPVFLAGMLVFGLGVGAAQQLRLAAADMYPPSRRAEGLGYVLTGSLIGVLVAPLIVSGAQSLAPELGLSSLALAWLAVPVFVVPGIFLVTRIRPDPKEIAAHLDRYYPGYTPPPRSAATAQAGSGSRIQDFVRDYPKLVAFVASFAAQGNMTMIMAMTSLVLLHHGHDLPALSFAVSIHVVGMFGLSLPLGKMTDRFGRRNLLLAGIAIAGAGAMLVPVSPQYFVVTAGTFLVGLGWSCVNVAVTAIIADTTPSAERGRAIGMNDTFSNGSAIVLPLVGGPLAEYVGLNAIGILGLLLMIPPFVLALRLKEPSPGKYATKTNPPPDQIQ